MQKQVAGLLFSTKRIIEHIPYSTISFHPEAKSPNPPKKKLIQLLKWQQHDSFFGERKKWTGKSKITVGRKKKKTQLAEYRQQNKSLVMA